MTKDKKRLYRKWKYLNRKTIERVIKSNNWWDYVENLRGENVYFDIKKSQQNSKIIFKKLELASKKLFSASTTKKVLKLFKGAVLKWRRINFNKIWFEKASMCFYMVTSKRATRNVVCKMCSSTRLRLSERETKKGISAAVLQWKYDFYFGDADEIVIEHLARFLSCANEK